MILFSGRGILLDIEGTTSSVAYVYDVLFPFARRHLHAYVNRHWQEPDLLAISEQMAKDAKADQPFDRDELIAEAHRLMDADIKATGLKQLQGRIWKDGYDHGELQSHVFSDVPVAMRRWHNIGVDVRIFSSGSVAAQRLFFSHTDAGDLRRWVQGHYDTTIGPKTESASYHHIASEYRLPAGQILFLSDVTAELSAAQAAGMRAALMVRPGNAPVDPDHGFDILRTFDQIEWVNANHLNP